MSLSLNKWMIVVCMCYLHLCRRQSRTSHWCWTQAPGGCWMWLGREQTTTRTTVWFTAKVRGCFICPVPNTHALHTSAICIAFLSFFLTCVCVYNSCSKMFSVALVPVSLTSISIAICNVRLWGHRSLWFCFDKCHLLTFALLTLFSVFANACQQRMALRQTWRIHACFFMHQTAHV